MKIFRFLPLMVGLAIPHLGYAAAPEGSLDIATFGAKGEGALDSRDAIQKAIDAAKENGAPVYIPAGRYIVKGDLWLPSKAHLVGEGPESVLEFSEGQLRSEKYGRRDFSYSFNYNNEQLYGGSAVPLAADAEATSDELTLASEHQFVPGDIITIFNNALDTWTILEDKNQREAWNGTGNVLYARGQIVEVAEVNGKVLKLKEPLETPMPAGARVEKHGGAKDVVVEKLKLVRRTAKGGRPNYVIHFEQPFRARLSELVIEGAPEGVGGGIGLSHWVYQCVVDLT